LWAEELLAQLIEETSLLTAHYERKEPVLVPRPHAPANPTAAQSQSTGLDPVTGQDGSVVANGVDAMLQLAAGTGNVLFAGGDQS